MPAAAAVARDLIARALDLLDETVDDAELVAMLLRDAVQVLDNPYPRPRRPPAG